MKGRADTTLLYSYEMERIPVAQRLLRTTDRAFQIIVADGGFGKLLRTNILARIAAFGASTTAARVQPELRAF